MEDAKNLLPILTERLYQAQLAEEQAKENRILLESQVSVLIPTEGTEQKTVTLSNGYRVTVKRPVSYKADIRSIQQMLWDTELPMPLEYKTTTKLDEKGYEWYREHHPIMFAKLAEHVVIKPLKISVKLKLPEGK